MISEERRPVLYFTETVGLLLKLVKLHDDSSFVPAVYVSYYAISHVFFFQLLKYQFSYIDRGVFIFYLWWELFK